MPKCCCVADETGHLWVLRPNWNAYTLDPVEAASTGKALITDLDDHFDQMICQIPHLMPGKRVVDLRNPVDVNASKLEARMHPGRKMMDEADLPPRNMRRNAWRFKADMSGVEDDRTLTTAPEMAAAVEHARRKAARNHDPANPVHRILAGPLENETELTDAERDQIVAEWRASAECPPESKFAPPAQRKAPPRKFRTVAIP